MMSVLFVSIENLSELYPSSHVRLEKPYVSHKHFFRLYHHEVVFYQGKSENSISLRSSLPQFQVYRITVIWFGILNFFQVWARISTA